MDAIVRLARIAGAVTAVVGVAPVVFAGVATASVTRTATAVTELYVTTHGSAKGPCSKSHPCNSVARAVAVANSQPFTETPVTINVGKGRFDTRLLFPDGSYPESKVTIAGASPSGTTLTAGNAGQVLTAFADAPSITVENLTITGGSGATGDGGGAVHDGGNVMAFMDVTFMDNTDARSPGTGGAVDDDGGTMTITDSTFLANSVTSTNAGGGAVAEEGGTLAITGSLFSGNTVKGTGSGGAVFSEDGHLSVIGSTLTGNSAAGPSTGGAIGLVQSAAATVLGSTINDNTAGGAGGLVSGTAASTIHFGGDILVGNVGAGSVCSGGGEKDLGYNVIDSATCSMGPKTKIASAAAVGLQRLASNGGPTRTERITKSSAAHDVVPVSTALAGKLFCAGQDERGAPRRQGPATKCDAGSYQFAPPMIKSVSPDKGSPSKAVTITGYGFVFVSLKFGSARPGYSVSGDVKIRTDVPNVGKGAVTIVVSNVDGLAKATFKVLPRP
jgi:hypothetical protein